MSSGSDQTAPFEPGPAWEQRYADNSTRWERGRLNPAFAHWQGGGDFDGLASMILPCCGRSPEPLAFAGLGMAVTALDFAPTAVTFQKKALAETGQKAVVQQADVLQWRPETPADALYDQTCLCALTPAVWPDYEAQMRRWLKPGGRAFMLFMQTGTAGGPPFDCPLAAMHTLFDDARWQWPDVPPYRAEHSSGKVELGVILTRR